MHTRAMLRRWPNSGTIHVRDEMEGLCVKTLSQILLGTQPPPDFVESIRVILDARAFETGKAIASERLHPADFAPEAGQALTHVHRFLDELICVRRTTSADQGDILSMLVRPGTQNREPAQSQEQVNRGIRDETISMINASLDATAAAMQWALCLVAQCPAAQERLRQELVLASIGRKELPVEEAELPFTEMVVHESLRLYPPNWMLIPRRCSADSKLGGFRVPRGSWLYIFPYVIHRDARWFTRPVLFDPDRFAPDNLGVAQRAAYMPLGLGPHVCIGKALSTIILTTILACILREYRVTLPSDHLDVKPEVGIVIRPGGDLSLIATRLDCR